MTASKGRPANREGDGGKGVYVDSDFLLSKAWWDLTGRAQQVLLEFLRKRQITKVGHKIKGKYVKETRILNQDEITFTYKEAQDKYGLQGKRFSGILDQLIAHGFIEEANSGLGICKVTTKFRVLVDVDKAEEKWRRFGEPGFSPPKRKKRITHSFPKGKDNPRHKAEQKKTRGTAARTREVGT